MIVYNIIVIAITETPKSDENSEEQKRATQYNNNYSYTIWRRTP